MSVVVSFHAARLSGTPAGGHFAQRRRAGRDAAEYYTPPQGARPPLWQNVRR